MPTKLALLAGPPSPLSQQPEPLSHGRVVPAMVIRRPSGSTRRSRPVAMVGNNDAAEGIYRNIMRVAQVGLGGWAIVAPIGAGAAAGNGAHDLSDRVKAADALIPDISDVDTAGGVDGQTTRAA